MDDEITYAEEDAPLPDGRAGVFSGYMPMNVGYTAPRSRPAAPASISGYPLAGVMRGVDEPAYPGDFIIEAAGAKAVDNFIPVAFLTRVSVIGVAQGNGAFGSPMIPIQLDSSQTYWIRSSTVDTGITPGTPLDSAVEPDFNANLQPAGIAGAQVEKAALGWAGVMVVGLVVFVLIGGLK